MNVTLIWQEFLTIATEEVGSRVVETWFKAVTLSYWDAVTKTVYLKAPNAFIKDWVMGQYSNLVQTHLCRLLNERQLKIIYLDESKTEPTVTKKSAAPVTAPATSPVMSLESHIKASSVKIAPARPVIHSRYQFDTFVVGPENSLAFAAAQAAASQPGMLYNPLLICGKSGLGKTHLLQAVGNSIRALNPKARIVYQTADRFVHEFIQAVRLDKGSAFEARYRDVDFC